MRAFSEVYRTPSRIGNVALYPAVALTGLDNDQTYSVVATFDVFDVGVDPTENISGYRIECVLNGTPYSSDPSAVRSSAAVDLLSDSLRDFDAQVTLLFVGKPSNGSFEVNCETGLGLTLGYKYIGRIIATEVETES